MVTSLVGKEAQTRDSVFLEMSGLLLVAESWQREVDAGVRVVVHLVGRRNRSGGRFSLDGLSPVGGRVWC